MHFLANENDENADWFCWQCECIDDSLDLVNEQCDTETCLWEDLFPEISKESNSISGFDGTVHLIVLLFNFFDLIVCFSIFCIDWAHCIIFDYLLIMIVF